MRMWPLMFEPVSGRVPIRKRSADGMAPLVSVATDPPLKLKAKSSAFAAKHSLPFDAKDPPFKSATRLGEINAQPLAVPPLVTLNRPMYSLAEFPIPPKHAEVAVIPRFGIPSANNVPSL